MLEWIAKGNDFSEYENSTHIRLDRVDKNGTHYYTDTQCPKCGGTGNIPYFGHVEGGVCFLCGGSGVHEKKFRVLTEEYSKKLEEKRFKDACKQALKDNEVFLNKEGFTPDGKTYIVLGNTWPIKSQLKNSGAFFCRQFGWHFNHPVDEWPTFTLDLNQPIAFSDDGPIYPLDKTVHGAYRYHFELEYIVQGYIKDIQQKFENAQPTETEWYGNIGERATLTECTCTLLTQWETMYGTTRLYKFVNPEGFIFTWKTGAYIESEYVNTGKALTLKGTIKEHSKFKGEKQTELTRCKISYEN